MGRRCGRLARAQAERAEATYPEDRREAQRQDEADLNRARQRVARLDRAAADAGTHTDELTAEQQLRHTMPQPQRIAEKVWRVEVNRQEAIRAVQQAAQAEAEPDLAPPGMEWELDYHARTIDRGLDIDRDGPSLGM